MLLHCFNFFWKGLFAPYPYHIIISLRASILNVYLTHNFLNLAMITFYFFTLERFIIADKVGWVYLKTQNVAHSVQILKIAENFHMIFKIKLHLKLIYLKTLDMFRSHTDHYLHNSEVLLQLILVLRPDLILVRSKM